MFAQRPVRRVRPHALARALLASPRLEDPVNSPLRSPPSRSRSLPLAALAALALLATPGVASADRARVQGMGGVDLFTEDDSNVFLNPALIAIYSNRAWFSLGVTGGGGTLGFDPTGGGAVRIRDLFNLGIVLNRSPRAYGFDAALMPVAEAYIAGGPGGSLAGPEGPSDATAPLRFPVDLFVGYGNKDSAVRIGGNVYYAGGLVRSWEIEDRDADDLETSTTTKAQTHLFNVTLGVAGGRSTDRVRPEGWLRLGVLSAWSDRQSSRETTTGSTPTADRILSLDRDVRVGGGMRVHIGDPSSLRGVVVSPGFTYDGAVGAYRFDDNLVNPDSDAEEATRVASAHAARLGVGVAGRIDDLRVLASASLTANILNVRDTVNGEPGEVEEATSDLVDLAIPELSIGAEYHVLPALLIRAGVRSTVGAGRTILTQKTFEGDAEDLFQLDVRQVVQPRPVATAFEATGGLGLRVRRFSLDATLGGLFLGQAGTSFLSRIDLSFNFD